jgi:thioredoxin 1
MSNSTLPTDVTCFKHFNGLLNDHTYLIADFYSTRSVLCEEIAPLYEELCGKHSVEGKFRFVKVNVDVQPVIAAHYGITASPTFRVLKRKPAPHEKCPILNREDIMGLESELKEVVEDIVARLAK